MVQPKPDMPDRSRRPYYKWLISMNNVDNVVICVNQGVNKYNLHLFLEHPDPGLNLPVTVSENTRQILPPHTCATLLLY